MIRKPAREGASRLLGMPLLTDEIRCILQKVSAELEDETLPQSVYFGPTALTHIKRLIAAGGTIVTDTFLLYDAIDRERLVESGTKLICLIDDLDVTTLAEHRHTTRAEVAVDLALAQPGPKLMVVGSAPTALSRLLQHRQSEPMSDTCVLTALTGYQSAIRLKERLWESDMACIVVRGKRGGVSVTAALINAILDKILVKSGIQ